MRVAPSGRRRYHEVLSGRRSCSTIPCLTERLPGPIFESEYTISDEQKLSNSRALAGLALLFERPMHPYEVAAGLQW